MNSGADRADTANVRHSTDSYFVRLDVEPHARAVRAGRRGRGPRRVSGRRGLAAAPPRAAGGSGRGGRSSSCLGARARLVGASGRRSGPGGVSGTVNGWISHVRGDVAKVSADPDLATRPPVLQRAVPGDEARTRS